MGRGVTGSSTSSVTCSETRCPARGSRRAVRSRPYAVRSHPEESVTPGEWTDARRRTRHGADGGRPGRHGDDEECPPRARAELAAVEAALDRMRSRAEETGEPLLDRPGSSALRTLRALAAEGREVFDAAVPDLLVGHRTPHSSSDAPCNFLPLVQVALAACAHRSLGWVPAVRTGYLPHALVTGFVARGPLVVERQALAHLRLASQTGAALPATLAAAARTGSRRCGPPRGRPAAVSAPRRATGEGQGVVQMTNALTLADPVAPGLYLPLQYQVESMAKDRETVKRTEVLYPPPPVATSPGGHVAVTVISCPAVTYDSGPLT
ncbi:Imm49 family immunity protein [Streptomyces vinaceus]|uniref:Imm49 family immunity protein n=1 Tax=Streptomyces vinaceus TaxID=1960 RepID=UPI003823F193